MKKPAAFISYARRDDKAYGRRITGIRDRLQGLVGAAIGRDFEIFQDCEGISWGQHWRTRLDEALEEALFLIPILTPSYFNSEACRAELGTFLELERRSGRRDRILSLYFLHAPVYEQKTDPLAAILQERQHRDWRHLRIDPLGSAKVMRALDSLAHELASAIHARRGAASPPATAPDAAGQTPTPETALPVPREPEATAPPPTSGRTRIGSSRRPPAPVVPEEERRKAEAKRKAKEQQRQPAEEILQKFRQSYAMRKPEEKRQPAEASAPKLVVLPRGEFMMGSPDSDSEASDDERPRHLVRIDYRLAVGRYPVTFEEWDRYAEDNAWHRSRYVEPYKPSDEGWGRGKRPVINVSWEHIQGYLRWLSDQTGHRYRLLSEAEWEYACRAGATTTYHVGSGITHFDANFGRTVDKTVEVGSYNPNAWGLYDMHGNV